MTDKEKLDKIWDFVESELKRVRSWVTNEDGSTTYDDFSLGMEEGLHEVLDFMDELED